MRHHRASSQEASLAAIEAAGYPLRDADPAEWARWIVNPDGAAQSQLTFATQAYRYLLADNPRWSMVDVKFKKKLKRNITLTELKTKRELKELILLRPGSRLSVSPVSKNDWDFIVGLA